METYVLRLLIIEDSEKDYQILLNQLQKFKILFDPIVTTSIHLVKNIIAKEKIDIIISESILPQFKAVDLLKYLKENNIHIPVIITSGSSNEDVVIECLSNGAVDYLYKDRLFSIGTAVERAYNEFSLSSENKNADEKLHISNAALEQSETRFREFADLLPQAVFEVDCNGFFIFVNKNAFETFGLTKEQLRVNHSLFDFIDPTNVEKAKGKFRLLLKGAINQGGTEYLALRNDKTTFPCKVFTNVVLTDGKVTGVRGTLIDISAQKKTELELIAAKENAEEMNKLKSSFLANMSHELRTPMIGIMGYAELLSNELKEPELKEMADTIIISSQRLTDTLNSILDLSRIEANKVEMHYEEVDVNKIILQVVKLFEVNTRFKHLRINLNLSKNVSAVLDKALLNQIITNLLDNAIKFTQVGSISIESKMHESGITLSIADTGVGISKDIINYIFDEFRQGSEGFNRRFQGSGLGLTITRKFVELLNGSITVKSEVDKGSEFKLYFPLEPGMGIKENKPEKTILIVDDDPISRDLLFRLLSKDYKIDFAYNGDESLIKVNENQFSLILMDINLGKGMNGIEVTKIIRRKKEYTDTPIIAITAYAMHGDKEKFVEAGCTSYVSKPFYKKDLLTVIQTYI